MQFVNVWLRVYSDVVSEMFELIQCVCVGV